MNVENQSIIARDLILYLILLSGFGWLLFTYQALISPLVISGLIAYLLYPGVTWLSEHTRIDRRQIVPIVYICFLILLILIIIYVAPAFTSQLKLLGAQLEMIPDQVETLQLNLEKFLGFRIPLESYFVGFEDDINQLLKPERVLRIIRGTTTNIAWVIIIFITSFHLLRDWESLREWLIGLSPEHLQSDLRKLHQEIKIVWQDFLRGQLFIMSVLGILSGLGAAIIGLPGALILGFLAGALALIPGLGPAVATAIAALVALTQGSTIYDLPNLITTVIVVIIFQAIQFFEGFWLTPRVMSRRLNLHSGLVLVAIVGTLFTLGVLMTLIIVPLIGSFNLVFSYARRKRAGLEPWPVEVEPQADEFIEAFQEDE
ncbi:MAG: AI-2E family transporter [Anaerolineales bacterium]|jgi:predicted PurR-regulated permease PerM